MRNLFQIVFLLISFSTFSFSKDINIDNLIKQYEKKFGTNKIIISIMDNDNQNIIYKHNRELANSYKFEPSSLLKPIVMSIALNNNLVEYDELFFLYNEFDRYKNGYYPKGIFSIGYFNIIDTKEYNKNYFNYEEILLNSSSIGMLQIAQKISCFQYEKGLRDFGFLSTEDTEQNNPYLKKMEAYEDEEINLSKSIISFGQGFLTTHDEVLQAYSVFNTNKVTTLNLQTKLKIREILIKRTQNENYQDSIKNTSTGFYTGTSQIAKKGKYLNKYIVSSFGFVDLEDKRYTIGITIIELDLNKNNGYYKYARYSSSPLFFAITKELIEK